MALNTQTINVNLKPLNEQAPATAGPVGRVDRMNNRVVHKFTRDGGGPMFRLDMRPGFNPVSSELVGDPGSLPGSPRWLADFRGQLVGVFDAQPYVYSEVDDKWVGRQLTQNYPTVDYHTLTKRPIFNLNTALNAPDSAAVGDKVATVFRSGVGGVETSYFGTHDTDGVALLPPRTGLITGNFRVKCVSDGSQFWVFSQGAAMTTTFIQVFDEQGAQLASASIIWGAARDNWDIRYSPELGQVVLATPLAATTDVRFFTYAALAITTVAATTPAIDVRKGCAWLDNSAGTNVYLSGCDNTFGVRAFEISSAGALTHTFAVDTANTDYVGNITGYAEFGQATPSYVFVAYSVLNDNTITGDAARDNLTRTIVCQRAGGTLAATSRSITVASRAYHDTQGNYFAVMYYQSLAFDGVLGGTQDVSTIDCQPSYFVLHLSTTLPSIVGQFEYGIAAFQSQSRKSLDFNPWHLSSVARDSDGNLHIALGYLGEQTVIDPSFTAATGINDYVMTETTGRPVATADALLIPGTQASRFDGTVFVEDGFQLAPEIKSAGTGVSAGGSLTVSEKYFVAVVWEWLDSSGVVVQSIPSVPAGPFTPTGGNQSITLIIETLRTTRKTNVRASVYCTFSPTIGSTTGGIELRKVGEVANDTAVDTVTFVVSNDDVTISGGQPMYTQPLEINAAQPLEYYPAPAFSRGCAFDGRTFVIGYDNAIWFSEQRVDGFGAPFNPFLRIIMPTTARVISLVPMDARLLILCSDGTAWTVPSGGLPNDTITTGSIPQPEQLPFTVGSYGAALMLPIGAIFAAEAGGWLMDRGLSQQFIGSAVLDELSNNVRIIDICVDYMQRVYLTVGVNGQGGTAQTVLVYDLVSACWYTWTAPAFPVVACSWKGRYVFADSTTPGRVWLLDKDDDSTFTDDGAPISTAVALSSMSFGGPNGYINLWGGQFFGQYKGPHLVNVSFTYDNDDTPAQTFVQPVGTDPGIYRWEFRQDREKMAAVAVTFEDSFTWPTLATIVSHAP